MIRTKKFENLPQITSISPSGKIVVTENGVDKVISFEDFSNLPPANDVWNNASTTFTASEVNVTDIQSAADSKLLDLKVNTSSKFVVRKDGNLGIGVTNPAARLDISDTVLAGSGSLAGSILNLAQTWNTTGNPTAIKLNVTNTNSGAASNLLDLQLGGSSIFNVKKDGQISISNLNSVSSLAPNGYITINPNGSGKILLASQYSALGIQMGGGFSILSASTGKLMIGSVLYLNQNSYGTGANFVFSVKGEANLRLGDIDAAVPVAQTVSVQSVIAGTTNTAGANFTIDGSQGTGTGVGGSIIFRTAKATTSSSIVNSLTEALTIDSERNITIGGAYNDFSFKVPAGGGSRSFSIIDGVNRIFQTSTNGLVSVGYIAMGASTPNPDIFFQRDAANTLALRNGINPQTFRVYNTFPGTGNNEFGEITWDSSILYFRPAASGTATVRNIIIGSTQSTTFFDGAVITFRPSGSPKFGMNSGGFFATNDNQVDIGFSNGSRPRNLFVASNICAEGKVGIGTNVPLAKLDIAETWNSNISVTGASGTGSVATITFATQAAVIPVGATVVVSSVNPSGYNGTFVVTASTVTSISYTNSTSTTYVSGGLVKQQYDAIRALITDTNSATTSNLLSLDLSTENALGAGNKWRFKVDKSGVLYTTGDIQLGIGLGISARLYMGNGPYSFGGNNGIFLGNGVTGYIFAHGSTQLWRGSADHIIEQRNGVNPQTSRIYGTYNDVNNYARLAISCDTSGNAILATEGLGTGAAGTISIGNANKIILGTSAGVDLAFRATDSTSVGFRIGSGNTLEIVRSDAGAYANITANNITIQGTLSTLYAAINSNVNVAPTTGEHVALIASSSSNGTAANGFGTRIVLRTESSTTAARDSGAISTLWSDATDATRTSDLLFYNALNGTLTERMRILGSNGNVGIGTTTPLAKLQVGDSTGSVPTNTVVAIPGVNPRLSFSSNDISLNFGGYIQTSYSGGSFMTFGTRDNSVDTNGLTLKAGKIGIGTTSPSARLHIAGGDTSLAFTAASLALGYSATATFPHFIHTRHNAATTVSNAIDFYTSDGTEAGVYPTNAVHGLTITNGNVGIGTTAPTARLDIVDTTLAGSGSLAGSILNLAQTWNTTGAPTAIKLNVTNTASGAASNLLDLQVGGVSQFSVNKIGTVQAYSITTNSSGALSLQYAATGAVAIHTNLKIVPSSGFISVNNDLFISRRAAANLKLGDIDAVAPIAQTLSVQSVIAGATNTAGANFTIDGSQGTGTGAGGSIVFRTAAAGSSGSTVNALDTALLITADKRVIPTSLTIDGWLGAIEIFNNLTNAQNRTFPYRAGMITREGIFYKSTGVLAWTSGDGESVDGGNPGLADTILRRDAANTLALRNGVNPQTFRLYNTYTDATTFERLNIKWDTNVLKIGTEKGISGGTARAMELQTDGVTRMTVASGGNVGIGVTNPLYKLEVAGTFKSGTGAVIGQGSSGGISLTVNASTGNNSVPVFLANDEAGSALFSISSTLGSTTTMNSSIVDITNILQVGSKLRIQDQLLSIRVDQSSPANSKLTVKAGDAEYVNRAGGDLDIQSGAGAGSGDGGKITFFTSVGIAAPSITNTQVARMTILPAGNVGIGITSPTEKLDVVGNVKVSGHFSAATKSFLIDHPTKEGKKLQYGVVESNQHSVLVRGKTAENIIELPEEWAGLVHEDSVTVQLTPIGSYQQLFVISQDNQRVVVGGSTGQYNYTIYGERKDVDKLITEI